MTRIAAILILAICIGSAACASNIPWKSPNYVYSAQDESLPDMLKNFCSMQGIKVVVGDRVSGKISGKFQKISPDVFLDNICKANSLVWFYDGGSLYINRVGDVKSGMIPMSASLGANLRQVLEKMGVSLGQVKLEIMANEGIIVLTGPPRFFEMVSELTKQLEEHDDRVTVQVFPLKNAWANDLEFDLRDDRIVVPGVATVLQNIASGGGIDQISSNEKAPASSAVLEKLKGKGLSQAPVSKAKDKNSSSKSSGDAKKTYSNPDGGPQIYADVRLNSVVIRDTRRNIAIYSDIIKELDVPVAIIEINAAIIDINASLARTLGSDWLLRKKTSFGYIQGGMDSGNDATSSSTSSSTGTGLFGPGSPADQVANLAPGVGGNITSLITWDGYEFLARIHALENKGEARILSRPSVLTLDNVEATLRNDQTFYVRVAGNQEVDLYNVSAGTTLRVTPHLIEENDKRKIKLVVNIRDGNVTADSVDSIPIVSDSSINTQATILENQSLLVGGYTKEKDSTIRRATPWLSEIPVLGYLFKKEEKDREKNERLFLITPRVVSLAYEKDLDVNKVFQKQTSDAPGTNEEVDIVVPDGSTSTSEASYKKHLRTK